jgi:hypothetical protein
LVHYIALCRKVLDLFKRRLELQDRYASESTVHDIIFPRKGNSDGTSYENHNLWIVDERLNFTEYVDSDKALEGGHTDRPDLLIYNKRILFRGDNEPSNPITVFEFKRPQRDDFTKSLVKGGPSPANYPVREQNPGREGQDAERAGC